MCTASRKSRGISLAELVIASFVGLLLLTATYELLVPGLRAWTASNRRSHVRQGGLATLTRIGHDLRMTCIESVVLVSGEGTDPLTGAPEDTAWLSMLTACDETGELRRHEDGFPEWQRYVVIYHDPQSQQVRLGYRELLFDETKSPPQLRYRLENFAPQDQDRVIGRKIVGLRVEAEQSSDQDAVEAQSAILRANPIVLRIHIRDDAEDCVLETAASAALVGNPALGSGS